MPSPLSADERDIHITLRNGTVSAKIREAPVRAIIGKLKEKGIWFRLWFKEKEPLLDETVSVQFRKLSIQRGIERIFSSMNCSLVFDHHANLLGIFLLGKPEKYTSRRARRIPPRRPRTRYRRR
jgi:hypothetical protein